jgi:hypothetical protein
MLVVDDFELFRQFVVELLGKDRNYRSMSVNIDTRYKIHYMPKKFPENHIWKKTANPGRSIRSIRRNGRLVETRTPDLHPVKS